MPGITMTIDEQSLTRTLIKLKDMKAIRRADVKKANLTAMRIFIPAMRAGINDSKTPHHRYKGGKKVATYYPGNLKRSIGVIKTKTDKVMVGPVIDKGGSGGTYRGPKTDGWYGHFVEYGTAKMKSNPGRGYARKAYDKMKGKAEEMMKQGYVDLVNKKVAKLGEL